MLNTGTAVAFRARADFGGGAGQSPILTSTPSAFRAGNRNPSRAGAIHPGMMPCIAGSQCRPCSRKPTTATGSVLSMTKAVRFRVEEGFCMMSRNSSWGQPSISGSSRSALSSTVCQLSNHVTWIPRFSRGSTTRPQTSLALCQRLASLTETLPSSDSDPIMWRPMALGKW